MLIVKKLCPGAVVRRLNVNGKDVKLATIAHKILTQYKFLNNKYYPIVILIDKEARSSGCAEIVGELQTELSRLSVPLDQIHIGVCDQMIENWIVADDALTAERFDHRFEKCEGMNGKAALKRLFPMESPYQETVHGVELLTSANPIRIAERSSSFSAFVENFPILCPWLDATN
jgi:hypothetical protein